MGWLPLLLLVALMADHQVASFAILGQPQRRTARHGILCKGGDPQSGENDQTSRLESTDDDPLEAPTNDSSKIHEALANRLSNLKDGIGKRYVCRTQQGFLNIHEKPGDPFDTGNIVGRLVEGQIVTSTKSPEGPWIHHDGGGWSISVYKDFVWLEPLET